MGHCVPLLGELLGNPPLWIVLLRILFQDGRAKVILLELKEVFDMERVIWHFFWWLSYQGFVFVHILLSDYHNSKIEYLMKEKNHLIPRS